MKFSALISHGIELYRLERMRLLKFGSVGILATLVHYSVATGFAELGGLPIVAANLVGWLFGLVVSWFGHRHFTFSKAEFGHASPLAFTAIAIFAICVSSGVASVTDKLGAPAYIGLLFAIGIIPVITFIGHRFLVFRRKLPQPG